MTAFILKVLSRRSTMILFDFLGILFCGLAILKNVYTFLLARFLMGIVVGINSSVGPLFI